MKKLFNLPKMWVPLLAALVLLSSCDKDDDEMAAPAQLSVTHASPGSPNVDVYVDGVKVTTTALSYPGTTGVAGNPYLSVSSGTRNIKVSPNGTLNVIDANVSLDPGKAYSVFAHGVLGTGTTLRALLLMDDLATPASGKAHIRFIHLSPDAPAVDVELVKTGSAAINLTNIPYVGPSPNAAALSTFTPVDAGAYTVNVRANGSATVVLTAPIPFAAGKIYTIYARGLLANGVGTTLGLNASVINHN